MANRWERGKLGPYTMPQDFTEGGVALNGINNVTPQVQTFLLPAGTLVWFDNVAFATEEANLVVPSGQTLNRSSYSDLFSVVGELYGSGDGSTTFDLPNLTYTASRAVGSAAASGVGQFQVGTMWDHTHQTDRYSGSEPGEAANIAGSSPITQQGTLSLNFSPSNIQYAQTTIANNFVGPSIPLEAKYLNSYGMFATRTYKLFPAWTTKTTVIPLGGIISFIGNDDLTALPGYLLCNGQSVSSSLYPNSALAGITQTPDLRGYFISSIVASETRVKNSDLAAHRHRYTATPSEGTVSYSPLLNPGTYGVLTGSSSVSNPGFLASSLSITGSASLGPGNESRPVNMSVNYFMRVA